MSGGDEDHPRHIIHNFISFDLCKELEFIHKSNCTIGYRPNVFSTTLSHLIATNSPHLIMPFIPLREKLKEKVEEVFGCEYELFVEFTGSISWTKGASIGWHSDDNRPYLKQRDFTAVCYLNSFGEDFSGGIFHFQDGELANYAPVAGDAVLYTADYRNVHSVDEITDGERLTLTLWFSRDASHDEDRKLISLLSQSISVNDSVPHTLLPGSSNMYWFSPDQASDSELGFDIRFVRLLLLGFDIYTSQENGCVSKTNSPFDVSELLVKPLKLVKGDELLDEEFANILHALQVVQFYTWKESELQKAKAESSPMNVVPLSQTQRDDIIKLRYVFVKDTQLAETVFGYQSSCTTKRPFNRGLFSAAAAEWEKYTRKLNEEVRTHLPYWISHQALFDVPLTLQGLNCDNLNNECSETPVDTV